MNSTGILRTVSSFLNGTTVTGDLYPGTSTNGYANQTNQYQGQVGAFELLSFAAAQKLSDTATGISGGLQGGRYQYVQFAADGTNYAAGQALYWKDETNYIVTNVAPTSTSANFAGVCIAAVTQGNYWFVQTDGVAWCLFKSSPSSTTASTGVYLVVNTDTFDALPDATADATAGVNKLFVGIAKDAPASAVQKRVYLKGVVQVN